jgi:hypothetical protein
MHTVGIDGPGVAGAKNLGLNFRNINELKLCEVSKAKYTELAQHLPEPNDPEYNIKLKWVIHVITHQFTVSADFVAQVCKITLLMHLLFVVISDPKYLL